MRKKAGKAVSSSGRARAVARLDRVFSEYIRLRDSFRTQAGICFRCISCGRWLPYDEADCGHYVNRSHMGTRFDEDNCHAQCRRCNRFDEGNIYNYRRGLVAKIGEERVLLVEAKKARTCKLSAVELDMLRGVYRKRVEEQKMRLGI